MTRALCALALLAVLVTSCAATLRVRGTAPDSLAEGTCARYTSYPATAPMWVFASVASFTDSVWANPGDPFTFSWQLPPGSYYVTAWARNAGGASCSSSVVVTATSRPAPVRVGP